MTTPELPIRVGELRPSQLMWAHGVGALVDLPHLAVVVRGLDQWDPNQCIPLGEPRLLSAVRRKLGPQVGELRSAPIPPATDRPFDPFGEDARIGVPVLPFPEYLRCPLCGLLAHVQSRLFELKDGSRERFSPDRVRYEHTNCSKGGHPTAVPARFLVACRAGHLDDFPWHYYVHRGTSDCRGQLRFFESGASLETANLWVSCTECGLRRQMVQAFDRENPVLPACRGRHAHLNSFDSPCSETLRPILLGASNGWFPTALTVLSVPTQSGRLGQLVEDHWAVLEPATSLEMLNYARTLGQLTEFSEFTSEAIWAAVEDYRNQDDDADEEAIDLKSPEWDVFTNPEDVPQGPDFRVRQVESPSEVSAIETVLLAERLREVGALIGFTRVDPPEEGGTDQGPPRAPVSSGPPAWVLGAEVRGEGVFLRFDAARLESWLERAAVHAREQRLLEGYRLWRAARRMPQDDSAFPGALYFAIHSFSHALLREFAIDCGYSAASIRERLYASTEDGKVQMAGLMLYTAAPDSEGTLGGLVELGRPENLGRLVDRALSSASLCSSDPLCSEHDPTTDRSLHGAACHACLFAAETSCEEGNRFLDRALLVPTFAGDPSAAAFERRG